MCVNPATDLPMANHSLDIGGIVHGEFDQHMLSINPASGLPMLDACIDIAGNAFGQSSCL